MRYNILSEAVLRAWILIGQKTSQWALSPPLLKILLFSQPGLEFLTVSSENSVTLYSIYPYQSLDSPQ